MHCAGQSYSCSSPETSQPNLALDEAGGSLIRGLLMRAAYGGLQGDIAMLRRFSLLWLARHASSRLPSSNRELQPLQAGMISICYALVLTLTQLTTL